MKISNKDAKLLYIVGGLLVFLVLYMYVVTPMQEKSSQMKSEIESLEKECRELEMQYAGMETYRSEVEEYRVSVKEDIELFPAEIKEEDIVAYLLNLEKENDIELMSIGFTEPISIVNFTGLMEVEGVDIVTPMIGLRIGTIATAELTYAELKEVLQYIYDTQTQTTLETVTVVYDAEKELLNGTFDFSRYTLTYEGAEYVPEKLPSVSIGQDDLFGAD